MNTSLIRHLKLNKEDDVNSCIDGFNHKALIKVESADASFEVAFANISRPNGVKQLSGEPRQMTLNEVNSASNFYNTYLRGAVSESLMNDKPNVDIAIIIMKSLGYDEFFTQLVLAKKFRQTETRQQKHDLLAKTLGFNSGSEIPSSVIENIIVQVDNYLNAHAHDNLEG